MDPLEKKVTEALSRYSMLPPAGRLGVGVSGGADSVCLLYVLHAVCQSLTVIHINHHWRGAESDGDAEFVRDLAAGLSLPCVVADADPGVTGNREEAARDARRAVFRRLMAEGAVSRVALAHTRNDQAETVLFRLLRGAYTTGLAGMRPVTRDGLVRPLLFVTRAEVEAWLQARGYRWREDSSNQDPQFARNRIRHHLLPRLERDWNPSLGEILANHATLAQDDEDYWTSTVRVPDDCRVLDIRSLPQPPALRRRFIRETIRQRKGDLKGIDFRHIEQVVALTETAEGHGRVQIPGLDILRSFEWLRFGEPSGTPVERDWSRAVHGPGTYLLPGGGEIVLAVSDRIEVQALAWWKVRALEEPLEIRNWRPGDGYQRFGRDHAEKLKTLFHDGRIPLWERRDWPVLCAGRRILWSRRFGPAAEFAAGAGEPVLDGGGKIANPAGGRERLKKCRGMLRLRLGSQEQSGTSRFREQE